MSTDISSTLARLRESAAVLNQLCDQGAGAVRALEEFLAEHCSVGVSVGVLLSRSESSCQDYYESVHLCYGRLGGKFRVHLSWWDSTMSHQDDQVSTAWIECSRDEKLLSLPKLADLALEIEKAVNIRVKEAESAIASINTISSLVPPTKGGAKNARK